MVQHDRGRGGSASGLRAVDLADAVNFAEDAINRALEGESWARDKLALHAGRTMRLALGPVARTFAVDADGRLSVSEAAPDLTLAMSPLRLPTLLAQPERWSELVAAEGDPALAATLAELALTLPWFVERTLSRLLGPIAGQQVADAGRRLLALPEYAAQRFGDSLGRYVADETRLAVGAAEARAFAADIAATAAAVDALAARIVALEKQK
jgi:ubiquinone biosynthesis accessory factor UbiJ